MRRRGGSRGKQATRHRPLLPPHSAVLGQAGQVGPTARTARPGPDGQTRPGQPSGGVVAAGLEAGLLGEWLKRLSDTD